MTPARRPRTDAERILPPLCLVAMVVFVAVGIGRPVWLDEANSVLIAARGFAGIADSLSRDNNLPGYYFLLSLWMRALGDSEIALRALSALFYLAGCGAVFALGKRVTRDTRAAAYGAWFYAASPLAIQQAQNIRMYSLLGMLSALSILALLRLVRERDRSWKAWTLFLAVNAAGGLTHVWFAFVLVAQLVAVLVFERGQALRFVTGAVLAGVPFLALWGGRFMAQLHNGAGVWMPPLQPGFWIYAPLEFYGMLMTAALYGLAACVLLLAGAATRERLKGGGLPLLATLFAASLAAPLLVSAVRPIYWPGRYAIVALPPLAVALGWVLAVFLPRPLPAAVAALLLVVQVAWHIEQRDTVPDAPWPSGQSDRATARFLLAHAAAGDAVVFTSLTRPAADYYLHRARAQGRFVEISFPAEMAAHPGWSDVTVSPARRVQLEAEAAATVGQLRALAARGASVWLYDGCAPTVSRFLKEKLDAALEVRNQYPLAGPYHQRLLRYALPAAGKQAALTPIPESSVARLRPQPSLLAR